MCGSLEGDAPLSCSLSLTGPHPTPPFGASPAPSSAAAGTAHPLAAATLFDMDGNQIIAGDRVLARYRGRSKKLWEGVVSRIDALSATASISYTDGDSDALLAGRHLRKLSGGGGGGGGGGGPASSSAASLAVSIAAATGAAMEASVSESSFVLLDGATSALSAGGMASSDFMISAMDSPV